MCDVIVSKGLSRQEKKERKHKDRDLCWSQPLPLTTCVVETYRFSIPVSSNIECACPVETTHYKFLKSQLLSREPVLYTTVSCVACD